MARGQPLAFKIDKDIPIPTRGSGRRNQRHPWAKLDVGDSFFSPAQTVQYQTSSVGRQLGRKFVSRKVVGGWRIWRVA